jgi:hypothetical protein
LFIFGQTRQLSIELYSTVRGPPKYGALCMHGSHTHVQVHASTCHFCLYCTGALPSAESSHDIISLSFTPFFFFFFSHTKALSYGGRVGHDRSAQGLSQCSASAQCTAVKNFEKIASGGGCGLQLLACCLFNADSDLKMCQYVCMYVCVSSYYSTTFGENGSRQGKKAGGLTNLLARSHARSQIELRHRVRLRSVVARTRTRRAV